jgi:hypothetical protein
VATWVARSISAGISEGLAGERLATAEPPPAFLQMEPAGACRDGDRMDAWMLAQPLLERPTRVAGEVVADQVELARGIGPVEEREEV